MLDEPVAARALTSVPGALDAAVRVCAGPRDPLRADDSPEGVAASTRRRGARGALRAGSGTSSRRACPSLLRGCSGRRPHKALRYAQRAGDRALELAYEEAARLYELGLQALELQQPVDLSTRYALLVARGDALARGGSTPEAEQAFLAAADLARVSLLPEHLARAALGYGGRFPWLRAGSDPRLVPLLEEALEALGEAEPVLRRVLAVREAGALATSPRSTEIFAQRSSGRDARGPVTGHARLRARKPLHGNLGTRAGRAGDDRRGGHPASRGDRRGGASPRCLLAASDRDAVARRCCSRRRGGG